MLLKSKDFGVKFSIIDEVPIESVDPYQIQEIEEVKENSQHSHTIQTRQKRNVLPITLTNEHFVSSGSSKVQNRYGSSPEVEDPHSRNVKQEILEFTNFVSEHSLEEEKTLNIQKTNSHEGEGSDGRNQDCTLQKRKEIM